MSTVPLQFYFLQNTISAASDKDDDEWPLEQYFGYKELEIASPIFGNIANNALGSIRAELYYPIPKEVRGRNLGNQIGHVALIQPTQGKQFLTEDRMATRERQLQTTTPFVLQSGGKHTIFTQRTHI